MLSSRREFFKRTGKTGLTVFATGGLGYWFRSRDHYPEPPDTAPKFYDYRISLPSGAPHLSVIKGPDAEKITLSAIESCGGIDHFISQGDRVVLKPNVSWDRVPEQAANTNPLIVKTVVSLCKNAGAKEVIVTDVSCNDPRRCFRRSGIAQAAQEAGATVILPEARKFKRINMGGKILGQWQIFLPLIEADKVINLPILKQHYLCRLTMGMKNWYGIIGGIRAQLHQNIHESIVDLAQFIKPSLIILDATHVMVTNGPSGGSLRDVKKMDTVIAGVDQVSVDTYGAQLFGLDPMEVQFLRLAHERGLGTMDLKALNIYQNSIG